MKKIKNKSGVKQNSKKAAQKRISSSVLIVKNAAGDPDTKAKIEVQNRINYIPKVSVIIPVYNVQNYLRPCLDSVLKQTLKEIEIICVDDGSTDGSLEILKQYAAKDNRITVLKQKNLHAGVARNAGLAVARGEYLSFLDSDDFFELNMLEESYRLIRKKQADILFYQYKNFNQETQQIEKTGGINLALPQDEDHCATFNTKDWAEKLFTMCNPMPWNKLIKRELVCRENLHFQSLTASNDVCFSLSVLACSQRITLLYKSFVYYRFNRASSLKNNRDKTPFNFYEAYEGIYTNLKERALFETFKTTFLNSFVSTALWTVAHTEQSRQKVIDLIKTHIVPQYGILKENKDIIAPFLLKQINHLYEPEIIVSLTSYPGRIDTVNQTVESILNQSLKADKVILWLAPEQFPQKEKDLPKQLLTLRERGLIIDWYHDIKSYKKLIPTLKKYPGALVITADDDNIYQPHWLEKLYKSYKKYPTDIQCHRVTKFYYKHNAFHTISGGKDYYPGASFLNKLVGLGGVLYPPNCFYKDILDEDLMMRLAPTNDDQWFWIQGILNNVRVRVVDNPDIQAHYVPGTQETGLTHINDKGEKLFWKDFFRLLAYYPEAKKRLIKESKKSPIKVVSQQTYARELQLWYQNVTGKYLNLDNPRTFNEKIQWLKLYDSTPLKTRLADKYLVREWVKEKIGEKYLIPLLGVYDKFDDIDFDKLPNQFVIKCNHGCGYNIIVKDKKTLDFPQIKQKINTWMNENFAFHLGYEMQYRDIQRKIIIEQFIENKSSRDLYDYKFWCFNGKVEYIQFLSERNLDGLKMAFYDKNWKKQSFVYSYPLDKKNIAKPDNLDTMIKLAEKLAAGFSHVRVDFYRLDDGTVYFGEMTFTSASGMCRWNEEKINQYFGRLIQLPSKAYNLDTGIYYSLPKHSKMKPFWLFFYNLARRAWLRKQLLSAQKQQIENQLHTFRLDIKNMGTSANTVEISAQKVRITTPQWFVNAEGQGKVIEGNSWVQNLNCTMRGDGKLLLSFRGPDARFHNSRIPLWVDYKSIKINGQEILSEPVSVWHDTPFRYEMPVKDGQTLNIQITQQPHQYFEQELKELIEQRNSKNQYIKETINSIISLLEKKYIIPSQRMQQLDSIAAEHFISLGPACRPAYWLKQAKLRHEALPFDWMMKYSLQYVIESIKTDCKEWFSSYKEDERKQGSRYRYVQDVRSGMVSMHGFPNTGSVADYLPRFLETFQRRMSRFKRFLKSSKHLCFVCNRQETIQNFIRFAKELHALYPHLTFDIVNVFQKDVPAYVEKCTRLSYCTIYNLYANDINERGGTREVNPGAFWIGNEALWKQICRKFVLQAVPPSRFFSITEQDDQKIVRLFGFKLTVNSEHAQLKQLLQQNQDILLRQVKDCSEKSNALEGQCAVLSKQLNAVNHEVQQAKLWIKQTYEAFPTINKQLANAQDVLLSQLVTEKKVNRLAAITSLELKKQRKHNQEMKNLLSGFVSATQNDLQSLKQREVVKPAQLQQAVQQLAQQLLQTSQKRNEQLLQLQELLLSAHHAALQAVKDLDIVKPAQLQQAVQQLAQQLLQTAQKRNEQLIQLQELLVSNHTTALQCLRGLDIIKPEHIQKTADQLAKQMQEIFHKQDEQLADMQKLLASGENTLQHLKGIDVAEAQQLKQTEEELTQRIAEAAGAQSELLSSVSAALRKQQEEGLQKTGNLYLSLEALNKAEQKTQAELQKQLRTLQDKSLRQYYELNFADLLHDSTQHSPWLKNKNFSLYGWAANYSFIYTLFRILDKVSPQHILEMGLGQTTRLTSQYVAYKNPAATLDVCEHNQSWIDIYTPELPRSEHIHVHHLELEYFDFEGKPNDKYKDIAKVTGNTKYNLIIVDGPVGGGKNFPRSNIVDLIPHNLAEDFIIIFDDADRVGEQKTIEQTQARLTDSGILFSTQQRRAAKSQFLIFSRSLDFIQYL